MSSWHSGLKTRSTRSIGEENENVSDWSSGLKTRSTRANKEPFDMWGIVKDSAKDALRKTAQIPRNIAAGAGDILDLPIMAANLGLRGAGVKSQIPHVGQGLAEGIDTLTGGYTKPQTSDERTTEAVTRAISSIPSGALTGAKLAATGIKGISKLGRGLQKINPIEGTNIAGTGAGALAGHAYNEANPQDFMGTLGTGLAADLATRTAMGLANKRNWATALKINPETVETFKEIGSSPTLGQVSDSDTIKHFENIFKNTNFDNKMRNQYAKQYENMLDIVGQGSKTNPLTELQLGDLAKESLESYGKKVSGLTGRLKNRWESKLEKTGQSDEISIYDTLGKYEKMEAKLPDESTKRLLRSTPVGKAYAQLRDAADSNSNAHIDSIQFIRTNLLSEIESLPPRSPEKAQLRALRSELNADIRDKMQGVGALKEWNEYNKFYTKFAILRKPSLVVADQIPAHEAHILAKKIHDPKHGRSLLNTIYASQNKTDQNLTMNSLIQTLGKKGDEFNLHKFQGAFSKLPPETQDALLKPLSVPQRKKFEAVIKTVKTMKELNEHGNPSRTAYTIMRGEVPKIAGLAAANVYSGKKISDSVWQYALYQAAQHAVSRKMFTNPKFINWAYKGSKMTPKARVHHIAGLKGILGRPVYQEIRNALSGEAREK